MGIRIPTNAVLTANDASYGVGTNSVAGGDAYPFLIPQDTDNVVVKFTASITGGGVSAIFQTSDDGGTTYYDVARTSIVSNARNLNAEWLSIPVISAGVSNVPTTSVINAGSLIAVNQTIGSAAASTLLQRQMSGLPILGVQNRIFFVYTGTVTATSLVTAVVKVNSQSHAA